MLVLPPPPPKKKSTICQESENVLPDGQRFLFIPTSNTWEEANLKLHPLTSESFRQIIASDIQWGPFISCCWPKIGKVEDFLASVWKKALQLWTFKMMTEVKHIWKCVPEKRSLNVICLCIMPLHSSQVLHLKTLQFANQDNFFILRIRPTDTMPLKS